jgi:hypothetical protein
VGRHLVELDLQLLHIARSIVCFQDAIGHGTLCCFFLARSDALLRQLRRRLTIVLYYFSTVYQKNTVFV